MALPVAKPKWLTRLMPTGPFRTLLLFGIVLALVLPRLLRSSGPKVGTEAAAFELPLLGQHGTSFSLAEHRGQPIVVEAFAPWCGACERTAAALRQAASADRPSPVVFLSVALDTTAAAVERIQGEWHVDWNLALDDGQFARAYNIRLLPTFVVIDPEGRVRHVESGMVSASDIESWLEDIGPQ